MLKTFEGLGFSKGMTMRNLNGRDIFGSLPKMELCRMALDT